MKRRLCLAIALLVGGTLLVPRLATGQTADAVAGGAAASQNANSLLFDVLETRRLEKEKKAAAARRAAGNAPTPAPNASAGAAGAATPAPFADSVETPKPGIPFPDVPGIKYTVDVSSAYPYGNIGFKQNSMPGGVDGVIFAGPDKYTRLQAGYYQIDEYPVGFDTGAVPAYLQKSAIGQTGGGRLPCNFAGPLTPALVPNPNVCNVQTGEANLFALQNDATVKDRIELVTLSKLFYVTLPLQGGVPFPFVITPSYVARTASIGGADDRFLVYNPYNFTYSQQHLRTAQTKALLLTIPFAKSGSLYGTYTAGPVWLLHTAGLNQHNSAQIFQIMDVRYFANRDTTIFFQPQVLINYLPNDFYAEHLPSLIAGVRRKIGPFFLQGFLAAGGPSNPNFASTGRLGVIDVTCVKYNLTPGSHDCTGDPNPRTNTAVTFGGVKATQIILQFGFGTPSVIPL